MIRGPGVVRRYLKGEADAADAEGWFDTGDIATIDANGYVRITDRSKDLIKSGGEWISSIELENWAVAHPQVAEAAAIGGRPSQMGRTAGCWWWCRCRAPAPRARRSSPWVAKHVAKWQVPDDVIFMEELPHTATGKISKLDLRRRLAEMNYALSA
ncbi:MAG: hypothetical protein KatS3mg118_3068 [Paracoccaceae bacterium]|nr:MAG: hypothetical protein KatS3mg118_3068 [Paracoccaceae bacterium]